MSLCAGAPGLQQLQQLQALVDADVSELPQVAAKSQLQRDVIDQMSRKLKP